MSTVNKMKADRQLIQEIELDEEKFKFDEKDDVYSISNVLKQCKTARSAVNPSTNAKTCGSCPSQSSISRKPNASSIPRTEVHTVASALQKVILTTRNTHSFQL
jgi:hypothetical protein